MSAATKLPAFAVDKKGLAKLLERKGKSFAVVELVQNAWDEDTTEVHVTLEAAPGQPGLWKLVVEDDNPEGFKDLAHAYTLFAESLKKGDATKRGRFNLGEKLVIAVCEVAQVKTTKGTVQWVGDERQHKTAKRKAGSEFTGLLRLTQAEVDDIASVIHTLLPPDGITTTYNMTEIPQRAPIRSFTVALRTELADDEGRLRPTTRKTVVEVFEPLTGEAPSIYELGIPVVATGDRWHVNVMQKVPLPTDRDNVPPGYLRDIRTAVLNACHDLLTPTDGKAAWVTNALEDEAVTPEAATAAFTAKFGDKTVIFDPNDAQANKIAIEQGYTVVPGGALPAAAWKNVKGAGAVQPAGKVTPSMHTVLAEQGEIKTMNEAHWPEYVRNVASFCKALAKRLIDVDVTVKVGNDPTYPADATYGDAAGKGELMLNLGRLGHKWFEAGVTQDTLDLLFDEFGHHYESDHLSENYYRALRTLGAKTTMLALAEPSFFEAFGVEPAKVKVK